MSQSLTFMMGEYEATFPVDRHYAKNHMWGQAEDNGATYRFGFSAYAVRLLQDVYFLDWCVDVNDRLEKQQEIGSIESKKAESSLYSPLDGHLIEFNQLLLGDPSYINTSPYEEGWLFRMQSKTSDLLDASSYMEHLKDVWEVTQRTIKGQLN